MDSRLVFAAELEERDDAVARRLGELAVLAAEIDDARRRAEEIRDFRDRLPAERAHLDDAHAEAAASLERAVGVLAAARRELERARSGEARDAARAVEARAAAAVRAEEEQRDRLAARRGALEHEAEQLGAAAAELERTAPALAARLEAAPRVSTTAAPEPGLDGVLAWAARAQAALLVARSGLESERERIVREANELASSVLGEPLVSTSVALVRRRLEEALAG